MEGKSSCRRLRFYIFTRQLRQIWTILTLKFLYQQFINLPYNTNEVVTFLENIRKCLIFDEKRF